MTDIPKPITTKADLLAALLAKQMRISRYRETLARRRENPASNVADIDAADGRAEAEWNAIENRKSLLRGSAPVAAFPSDADIDRLRDAVVQLENAVRDSADLNALLQAGDELINAIGQSA